MKRNTLFYIHSWTGLVSGFFIVLMSLSGSLLVFHEELDRLQYPSVQVIGAKPVLPVDSCYRHIQQLFPQARISHCSLAGNIQEPFIFSLYDSSYQEGKSTLQVFLHPQTGERIWQRGGNKDPRKNFMAWLSSFHNSFHLKKKGEWLLAVFGVIFLISILSGLWLYRRQVVPVLLFRKWMFRQSNLHQLIGVYALLFNCMIALTGIWMQRYVFKKTFYETGASYTYTLKPSPVLHFGLDSALQEARKKHPSFTAYVIYFAGTSKGNTAVYGSRSTNSFIHSKKFADAIFIDSSGAIQKTAFVTTIAAENRRDIINAQIHYGRYGGWPVKLLYVVLGLSGGILAITGFLFRRKRKQE